MFVHLYSINGGGERRRWRYIAVNTVWSPRGGLRCICVAVLESLSLLYDESNRRYCYRILYLAGEGVLEL